MSDVEVDDGVAPPATAVWYDLEVTTAEVLAMLRLTEQDVDAGRIQTLIPAGALLVDTYVDRCEAIEGPPPPATIQQALDLWVVDLYRNPTVAGGFVPAAQPPPEVRVLLAPHKERFGVS